MNSLSLSIVVFYIREEDCSYMYMYLLHIYMHYILYTHAHTHKEIDGIGLVIKNNWFWF